MIAHPFIGFLFLLANISITAGYLYVALAIVPRVQLTLWRTKIGGVGFFLLCGLTHLELTAMTLFDPDMSAGDMAVSWPMMIIMVPQAICVWLFVTGLFIEIGEWGRLPTRLNSRKRPGG